MADIDGEPTNDSVLLEAVDAVGHCRGREVDDFSDVTVRSASVLGKQSEYFEIGFVEISHVFAHESQKENSIASFGINSKMNSPGMRIMLRERAKRKRPEGVCVWQ